VACCLGLGLGLDLVAGFAQGFVLQLTVIVTPPVAQPAVRQ